jgi:hypothetical protein
VHPGNVQSRNLLLATLAINTQDTPDAFHTSPGGLLGQFKLLQTSTVLPLFADECLFRFQNGTTKVFNVTAAMGQGGTFEVALPLGTSVIVRVATAVLGIKVFHVDHVAADLAVPPSEQHRNAKSTTTPPPPPPPLPIKLVADVAGLDLGAMRLTCEHFRAMQGNINGTLLHATHLRFAALFAVETITSSASMEAFASMLAAANTTSSTSSAADGSEDYWDVSAQIDHYGTELFVRRNLTCSEQGGRFNQSAHTSWNCLVRREVNGSAIIPTTLEVNGVSVAPPRKLES